MKYFYDTEFIEDGKTIELISFGIVSEDNRELYIENSSVNLSLASEWVKKNVISQLKHTKNELWCGMYLPHDYIHNVLLDFCSVEEYGKPEFWGYYSAYDHVVLCQLFGSMINLPKGWPMYTNDIKQLCDSLGNPQLPEQGKGVHDALEDAKWNKLAYEFLQTLK